EHPVAVDEKFAVISLDQARERRLVAGTGGIDVGRFPHALHGTDVLSPMATPVAKYRRPERIDLLCGDVPPAPVSGHNLTTKPTGASRGSIHQGMCDPALPSPSASPPPASESQ